MALNVQAFNDNSSETCKQQTAPLDSLHLVIFFIVLLVVSTCLNDAHLPGKGSISVQFQAPQPKGSHPAGFITRVSTNGTMSFQFPPPLRKGSNSKKLQTQSSAGSVQGRPPCPEANDVLVKVIALVNAVAKVAASKGCGQGNEELCFGNSCYVISEKGETWAENQKSCKAEGGDLVSLETEAEWQFVNSEIQKITLPGDSEWHIGLKKEGDWKWVSGSPLTIEKWQRYEPSGDGNAAVMSKDYPTGSKGLFNDLPGQIPRAFICEIPKAGAAPQPAPQQPPNTPLPASSPTPPAGSTAGPPGSTAGPTVGPSTQPAGGSTQGMTGFEKDCLKAHNDYRAKHGVPPLKWSAELAADAQTWANELTVINEMKHDMESINKGVGENLAYFMPSGEMPTQCQGPKTPTCVQCREMVADWYAEESNFDYNTGESKGGVILHFTQVVWKETTELGMATATSADKWFTVARYKPRGNMGYPADYIENVPRPQS